MTSTYHFNSLQDKGSFINYGHEGPSVYINSLGGLTFHNQLISILLVVPFFRPWLKISDFKDGNHLRGVEDLFDMTRLAIK